MTVTLSGTSGWIELYLSEYTGADQTNPIDAQSRCNGDGGGGLQWERDHDGEWRRDLRLLCS